MMNVQVTRLMEELRHAQGRVNQLMQQLSAVVMMKEGDLIRAKINLGGSLVDHVGVVRLISESSFFLELRSGSLLLVEDVSSLEIMHAASEQMSRNS